MDMSKIHVHVCLHPDWQQAFGVAMAQDGTCLFAQIFPNWTTAIQDMFSANKYQLFATKYPQGYQIVWQATSVLPDGHGLRRGDVDRA